MDLWVKRDDLTGFGGGGNKGRKLEFLMPEIVRSGATAVVCCGSAQSNFVRQMGAACAVMGLRCVAVTMGLPFEPEYGKPNRAVAADGGNGVLNRIYGTEERRLADGSWETLYAGAAAVAEELRAAGERVYEVPIGGSSPMGAYAFYLAGEELGDGFDWVVTATSSGSTLAGLGTWFLGSGTRVLGVSCDPEEENRDDVLRLSGAMAEWAGLDRRLEDVDVRFGYAGEGYGVSSEEGLTAIEWLARRSGVLLDPVYSGKAFAGLLDLVGRGEVGGRVCFWHTGGVPTLFAR